MLKQPRKTKYRKYFKRRKLPKSAISVRSLVPSEQFSLIAQESTFLNWRQLEAARTSIRRSVGKDAKLEILLTPDIAVSGISIGSRMGKGKGKTKNWVSALGAGRIILKLNGLTAKKAIPGLQCGANKLPLKLKIFCC